MSENLPAPEEPRLERASAWAPLRVPTFRMLWLVWLASNTCMWMNDVAAAWVMTSLTSSPTLIALVQTASALPVFLLGLPSGAFADILDRRRYFMVTQFWIAANAAVLFAVAVADALTAPLLLALVFTNGIGLAMRWPVYAAILPEVVPRSQLGEALALNAVAVNTSRVVGPLVAGAIISAAGDEYVFAVNFVVSILAGIVLYRWKRESKPSVLPGERFIGAMRLGFQFVRESRRMRDALVRTATFFLHSTAIFALLPLVAKGLEGGGAGTFTLLLAALGAGAIAAATQLPRIRHRWNRDQIALVGSILNALGIAVLAVAPNAWVAVPAQIVSGAAWILVANSVTIAAQLSLPDWVRARGMAIYQMAIMGGSALGAAIWGKLAEMTSIHVSLGVAAASMLVFLAFTRTRTLEGSEDHTPTRPFEEPVPARPVELDEGPVLVTIEYVIDPGRSEEFDRVMAETRSARMRAGAVSWGLFEDLERPGRFVEYFACDTWADYLRRFDRFTAADERLHERRRALHIAEGPPRISRFVARHPPG
ncbi:MAG: MFS transporter [Burkholderiales bacterium]|nr:MFS transporter [Burkholderiales bacterium]